MKLFTPAQRKLCQAISNLSYSNPFLPERIEWERNILLNDYVPGESVWSMKQAASMETANLRNISIRTNHLAEQIKPQVEQASELDTADAYLYVDLVLYLLFDRYRLSLDHLIETERNGKRTNGIDFWQSFLNDLQDFHLVGCKKLPIQYDPEHLLACFFQLRRAFYHLFYYLVGSSQPAAQLRATVWQSIFTCDLQRYQRTMYRHMGDVTTLIVGPSGTGKELVAQAIGHSRYLPFSAKGQNFQEAFIGSTHSVNLSALSPTLIESELFGHRKGAFTGAISDRVGWFDLCQSHGTVFLDEIGELDASIQVKLLRVLQSRTYQRLGDTHEQTFQGKIVAATNRNLSVEIAAGNIREDFYYRLCADRIETPSLRKQLDDCPEDLDNLLQHLARRIDVEESHPMAVEVAQWIKINLPADYLWPGNVRELEQCFRNILIHGHYQPTQFKQRGATTPNERLLVRLQKGQLTANELLQEYCSVVYAECGSYQKTADRLGVDRRTVKSKLVEKELHSSRE